MKPLQLFVRSGCHLCEAMEEELSSFIESDKIQVERIYIDNDDRLMQLYGERIPVLTFNGSTICEYFLDPETLERALTD
jgi:hypothetical protein